ncbi:MAG: hypothetical protein DRP30_03405 [Thermotoga sp.]|nr:MAG: hypothetical protein DRP30_03405 [Thermotoga sp.]
MDTFAITIAVIFVATLIISYFKSSSKDSCLKDFDDFPILVEFKNGKTVWGKMRLEATGMWLEYEKPHDNVTHKESGFLLYKKEFPTMFGVFRLVEDLSSSDRRRRDTRLVIENQKFLLFLRRKIRNFFAAVRDAFVETISLLIGRYGTKSSIISQNKKYVKGIGESVVDYIGNSYDPILEKLLGRRIVYEVQEGEKWREYVGTLKNYTKDFIEIVSSKFPVRLNLKMKKGVDYMSSHGIELSRVEQGLRIRNIREERITVHFKDRRKSIDPKSTEIIQIDGREDLDLTFTFTTLVDAVFPRIHAVVRHTVEEK